MDDGLPERRLRIRGELDLHSTLYSGQLFRWHSEEDGAHVGFIDNIPVRLRSLDGALSWQSANPLPATSVRRFFRLDGSHERFLQGVPEEPLLRQALARFPGLRLVRQDPWEALVSFVISQNSNEAKIRSSIERIARACGEPVQFHGRALHRFPTPPALARLTENELRQTGIGYRASYVHSVAEEVAQGRLRPDGLARLPYERAFNRLLEVQGIGPKVADCILLYGCGHLAAFPTDVWVRRFMQESFFRARRRPSHERLREIAWQRFGPAAGYAQHFLFHYRRSVGRLAANSS